MKKKLITLTLALSLIAMLLLSSCVASDGAGLGDMYVNNVYPSTNNIYSLGSSTYEWNVGYFKSIYLKHPGRQFHQPFKAKCLHTAHGITGAIQFYQQYFAQHY